MKAVVKRTWVETPEIRCFELAASDGSELPTFEPGAHIDVKLSNQLVRQYSLWNGPDEKDVYLIGVKLERDSRGGSSAMHGLSEGEVLEIGVPRNNFPLATDRGESILLAGGIGITPLLAMARHLSQAGSPYHLHLFARSPEMAPFRAVIDNDEHATLHTGLVPPELNSVLDSLLSSRADNGHVYICGPGPFMDLAKATAAEAGWPAERIHLEYFAADVDVAGDSFEVVLAQSGISLTVGPNQTILEAMAAAGFELLTSCEQGVCGTCVTNVIDGEPDHRDLYFNAAERESGKVITPCVSRCKGKRLVLDL